MLSDHKAHVMFRAIDARNDRMSATTKQIVNICWVLKLHSFANVLKRNVQGMDQFVKTLLADSQYPGSSADITPFVFQRCDDFVPRAVVAGGIMSRRFLSGYIIRTAT